MRVHHWAHPSCGLFAYSRWIWWFQFCHLSNTSRLSGGGENSYFPFELLSHTSKNPLPYPFHDVASGGTRPILHHQRASYSKGCTKRKSSEDHFWWFSQASDSDRGKTHSKINPLVEAQGCTYVNKFANKQVVVCIGIPPIRDFMDPGGEGLLLRVGNKSRSIKSKWETLLQWVHAKVDVMWKEAYIRP